MIQSKFKSILPAAGLKVDCEGARVESRKPVRTSSLPEKCFLPHHIFLKESNFLQVIQTRDDNGWTSSGGGNETWWDSGKRMSVGLTGFPNRLDMGDDRSVRNDSQIFVVSHYLRWRRLWIEQVREGRSRLEFQTH